MTIRPMIKATLCSVIVALFIDGSNPNRSYSEELPSNYPDCVLKKKDIDQIKERHVKGKPYFCQKIVNKLIDGKEIITLKYFNKDMFVLTIELTADKKENGTDVKYIFEDINGDGLTDRVQLNQKSYLRGVKTTNIDKILSHSPLNYLSCKNDLVQQMYTQNLSLFLEDNIGFCK